MAGVEIFSSFVGSIDCGAPLVVVSFTFGALIGGLEVVVLADD